MKSLIVTPSFSNAILLNSDFLCPRGNKKLAFSNFSDWQSVFENFSFRDGFLSMFAVLNSKMPHALGLHVEKNHGSLIQQNKYQFR